MKEYPKYEATNIEWLGEIPDTWEIVRLRYLCDLTTGTKDTENSVEDGEYPFYVRSQTVERISSYAFDGEAILTAGDGVGVCKVWHHVNGKFDFHQRVYMLYNFKRVIGSFLFYFLKENFIHEVLKLSAKSTVDSLRRPMFLDFPVSIPSLKEQTQIARFLDHQTMLIDALIEKKQQLLELLKEQRQAIITEAVTKGLNPDAPMKDSGIPWLGKIPEHWINRKIKREFPNMGSGTTPKSGDSRYHENGSINWLNTGDLNDGNLFNCGKKITEKALEDYSSLKIYPAGSVVIAMYGATIGKTSIIHFETTTNQACCVLGKSTTVAPKFMFYWFQAYKNQIISLAIGGGQPNISQEILKQVKFFSPEVEEQNRIVEFLEERMSVMDKLEQAALNSIALAKEYRQSIISEAVTGKVDVRDWKPELEIAN